MGAGLVARQNDLCGPQALRDKFGTGYYGTVKPGVIGGRTPYLRSA